MTKLSPDVAGAARPGFSRISESPPHRVAPTAPALAAAGHGGLLEGRPRIRSRAGRTIVPDGRPTMPQIRFRVGPRQPDLRLSRLEAFSRREFLGSARTLWPWIGPHRRSPGRCPGRRTHHPLREGRLLGTSCPSTRRPVRVDLRWPAGDARAGCLRGSVSQPFPPTRAPFRSKARPSGP